MAYCKFENIIRGRPYGPCRIFRSYKQMGKKKSETQQTNTFQYMAPPKNPYHTAAEEFISGYDGGASGVREAFARNANAITESAQGNQFYGGNTSPELKDKVRESRMFRNNLELGRGLSEAKQNEIAYKNSAYMSLGGATAPQLVQTGGTQNNQSWGSGLYSPLGGVAINGMNSAMA